MGEKTNTEELFKNAKQKILWSLLLEENKRQDLLKRMENYNEDQLRELISAFDRSQEREKDLLKTVIEIDPTAPQKINEIIKRNQKEMMQSAEKADTSEQEAETLLENL